MSGESPGASPEVVTGATTAVLEPEVGPELPPPLTEIDPPEDTDRSPEATTATHAEKEAKVGADDTDVSPEVKPQSDIEVETPPAIETSLLSPERQSYELELVANYLLGPAGAQLDQEVLAKIKGMDDQEREQYYVANPAHRAIHNIRLVERVPAGYQPKEKGGDDLTGGSPEKAVVVTINAQEWRVVKINGATEDKLTVTYLAPDGKREIIEDISRLDYAKAIVKDASPDQDMSKMLSEIQAETSLPSALAFDRGLDIKSQDPSLSDAEKTAMQEARKFLTGKVILDAQTIQDIAKTLAPSTVEATAKVLRDHVTKLEGWLKSKDGTKIEVEAGKDPVVMNKEFRRGLEKQLDEVRANSKVYEEIVTAAKNGENIATSVEGWLAGDLPPEIGKEINQSFAVGDFNGVVNIIYREELKQAGNDAKKQTEARLKAQHRQELLKKGSIGILALLAALSLLIIKKSASPGQPVAG